LSGGELFAKRRKRAENWVVDETSIGQTKPSAFADKFMQVTYAALYVNKYPIISFEFFVYSETCADMYCTWNLFDFTVIT
jgi:hypothetical protein